MPVHVVLHVDMDEFIAAVEVLRRPESRGRVWWVARFTGQDEFAALPRET